MDTKRLLEQNSGKYYISYSENRHMPDSLQGRASVQSDVEGTRDDDTTIWGTLVPPDFRGTL